MNHSPRPWKADIYSGIHDAHDHKVADMIMPPPIGTALATMQANRDLILKCVNGWEALDLELNVTKHMLAKIVAQRDELISRFEDAMALYDEAPQEKRAEVAKQGIHMIKKQIERIKGG